MLRDINISLSDGALATASSATGIHAKIGASSIVSDDAIVIRNTMNAKRIKELLGQSPLADAVMDSIENGASLIYCLPVAASTAGSAGSVTATATGTGTMTVSGEPTNAFNVMVKVTVAGALNAAAIRYSLDGGSVYGEEQTIPATGSVTLTNTGITLTFDAGETGFAAGDVFSFTTTAPAMTNADVLTALDKVRNINATIEFVHIVGESAPELWAAAGTVAETYHSDYKSPLFVVCEAPAPTSGQTADEYATQLVGQQQGVSSIYVQVVAARGIYTRLDNITADINLAGVICGFYAAASVQQSIGETKSFYIDEDKLTALTPTGITDEAATLDEARYLTVRRYIGLSGWYVTNARMMCPEGSDYKYAERIRVTNKIVREVRTQLLTQMQTAVDVDDLDAELAAIAELAMAPVDTMVDKKEISSARIAVPDGQDILGSETLQLVIRYVPVGHIREIEVDLGMENPYAATSD